MQKIARWKELIHHISTQSVTGQLYSASWELLHIELGSHSIIPKEHFALYEALPVTSNVKSSWDCLSLNGFNLHTGQSRQPP
jgi:hypothetical protein